MAKHGQGNQVPLSADMRDDFNYELEYCGWKEVQTHKWPSPDGICEVPSTRLCPNCWGLFKAEVFHGCKNGKCGSCGVIYCLRCMTRVNGLADHSTCCYLHKSNSSHSGECLCYETGRQVIDTNFKLVYLNPI
eukprot:TRINITY_DN1165_c1_g1_i1.p1 TRINITY_DN1165_c1_g1~~TRINITY_DN1165_c1_g1_i1.p1  ORF type:complete len:133 (+),score=17.66 TRINITY_DN1165_c1_g1_i1:59-457(+)